MSTGKGSAGGLKRSQNQVQKQNVESRAKKWQEMGEVSGEGNHLETGFHSQAKESCAKAANTRVGETVKNNYSSCRG